MKKLWKRAKRFFLNLFRSPETPALTSVLVSSYYAGSGLMLAIATKSLIVLLILGIPAVIWWVIAFAHGAAIGTSNA